MKVKAWGNSSTLEHHQHLYNASELWKLDACFARGHRHMRAQDTFAIHTCLHMDTFCTRLHRTRLHRTHAQDACFVQDTCFAHGNTYPCFAKGHREACLQWIHVYTRTHILHRTYAQDACFAHGHTRLHRTSAQDTFCTGGILCTGRTVCRCKHTHSSARRAKRGGSDSGVRTQGQRLREPRQGGGNYNSRLGRLGTTRAAQRRRAPPSGPARPGPGPGAQSRRAAAGEPHGAPGGGRLLPGRRGYVRAPRRLGEAAAPASGAGRVSDGLRRGGGGAPRAGSVGGGVWRGGPR